MTLRERLEHLAAAESSAEAMRGFLLRCKRDPVFFANTCAMTFDPRLVGDPWVPFLLYERQAWYVRFTVAAMTFYNPLTKKRGRDCAKEKSRDGGASWLEIWTDIWAVSFLPGYTCHYTSRDEDLVDKTGDKAAYFWRVEEAYKRLPGFVKDPKFSLKEHRGKFRFENPATGGLLTGEAPVPYFASGGRYTRCVADELSKTQYAKSLWTSAGQSTNSRHALGTPQGIEYYATLTHPEEFGTMIEGGNTQPMPVFCLDWRDDPRKNYWEVWDADGNALLSGEGYSPVLPGAKDGFPGSSPRRDEWMGMLEPPPPPVVPEMPPGGVKVVYPWFEAEEARPGNDEATLAQEVCINYRSSQKGRVYAEQMKNVSRGVYPRNPEWPLYAGVDPGRGDACAIVWVQWNPMEFRYEAIDYLEVSGRSAWFFVPFLTGRDEHRLLAETEGLSDEARKVLDRHIGTHWRVTTVFPEPSARQKAGAGRDSYETVFKDHGLWVRIEDAHKQFPVRINALRKMMKGRLAVDKERCGRLWAVLSNIHFSEEAGKSPSSPNGYVHKDSHGACALESVACFDPHKWDIEQRESAESSSAVRQGMSGTARLEQIKAQARLLDRQREHERNRELVAGPNYRGGY